MQLLLNGEHEGSGIDPVAQAPTGGGIAVVSSSPVGWKQEIRGIEIMEYDNARARHRAEDRGDPSLDSLISRDDDRWGGQLTSILPGKGGLVFTFRSDFQPEPLELEEKDVSTLFFAAGEKGTPPEADDGFILRLRGEGSLRVASCLFTGDEVAVDHPLLGGITLRRAGISMLEKPRGKTTTTREKE
ncbi:MAG: hypothetical protein EOP85_04595 [Verrucomicrobiaceae bacterium]|nr:MAG: hypothetical protein EOP85_04595 [Verrucomicrobiaceae bacterium]